MNIDGLNGLPGRKRKKIIKVEKKIIKINKIKRGKKKEKKRKKKKKKKKKGRKLSTTKAGKKTKQQPCPSFFLCRASFIISFPSRSHDDTIYERLPELQKVLTKYILLSSFSYIHCSSRVDQRYGKEGYIGSFTYAHFVLVCLHLGFFFLLFG